MMLCIISFAVLEYLIRRVKFMEKLMCTSEIYALIANRVWGVIDGIFVKRKKGTSYIETINILDKNISKITRDYYALFEYFYCDEDGYIKAFGGKYYSDYKDYRSLYLDNTINKGQILREVISAILELESIGIQYTDIHAKNIIVNSEGHMKLVDLDEAHPYSFKDNKTCLILDLIIECLILYDMNDVAWEYVTPRHAMRELEQKVILSKPLQQALNGVQSENSFYSKVDSYIDELLDKEKAGIIRKELITRNPHYF